MRCFRTGCETNPSLFCTCSKKIEYCCNFHMADHLTKQGEKRHKFFSTLKNLDERMRIPIIEKLRESIAQFNELKSKIFKISSNFNNLTIDCVKNLDKIIQYNKRLLKESIIYNQVNISVSYNKKYRENNLSLEMLQLNKKEQFKCMNFDKIITKTEKFENLLKSTCDQFVKPYNSTFLYYFINDTKYLIKFNTRDHSILRKELNGIQPIGRRPSLYYLNDGNIFCYGGGHNQSMGSVIYIDSNNFAITWLPSGKHRHSVRPVLFRNRIYVFGGWTDRCLDSVDYFDINLRRWAEMAKLPSPQSDTSPIKIKSQILISGCYKFFQSYDPSLNQYKDLKSGIEVDRYNILLKYKERVFLLCKKIYYCKKTKLKNWISHPSKTVSFDMNSSIPVIRDNRAYFIDETYRIFMFSFDDLSLNIISHGNI